MVPDSRFSARTKYLRRRRRERSSGMAPTRLAFMRFRVERKERLPRWGLSSPWRGTSDNCRATTRCRRRLHETPIQRQKETLEVQLLARTPRGSKSRPLKASSAATSVSLPLMGVRLSPLLLGVRRDLDSEKKQQQHQQHKRQWPQGLVEPPSCIQRPLELATSFKCSEHGTSGHQIMTCLVNDGNYLKVSNPEVLGNYSRIEQLA